MLWQMDMETAKDDQRRQVETTNCDKFIAVFCRFLPLGFEHHFPSTISLGDGVIQNYFTDAFSNTSFFVPA